VARRTRCIHSARPTQRSTCRCSWSLRHGSATHGKPQTAYPLLPLWGPRPLPTRKPVEPNYLQNGTRTEFAAILHIPSDSHTPASYAHTAKWRCPARQPSWCLWATRLVPRHNRRVRNPQQAQPTPRRIRSPAESVAFGLVLAADAFGGHTIEHSEVPTGTAWTLGNQVRR